MNALLARDFRISAPVNVLAVVTSGGRDVGRELWFVRTEAWREDRWTPHRLVNEKELPAVCLLRLDPFETDRLEERLQADAVTHHLSPTLHGFRHAPAPDLYGAVVGGHRELWLVSPHLAPGGVPQLPARSAPWMHLRLQGHDFDRLREYLCVGDR